MSHPSTKRTRFGAGALTVALLAALAAPGTAQQPELSARVWLDRGEDPLLRRGETARLFYRTNADAYVAIFQIDTNGTTRLLFPRSPDENHYVRAGRDYRLLFPQSTVWYVQDDPGVGYFFVVASPEPFDFRDFRYSHYDGGWDLAFAGRHVYSDPYVAMDDYVARLVPDWEYVPYALDFASYSVEQRYDYPRFLCYDCHGFRPYAVWNPYYVACTSFRVVIYDDPYYYPAHRYRGDRVVFVRPPARGVPRFAFKERATGEQSTPLVTSRPAVADRPGVPGGAAPRRSTAGVGSGGAAPPAALGRDGSRGPVILRGRPSDALPGRGGSAPVRGSPTVRGSGGDGAASRPTLPDRSRPVLQRRPGGGDGGGRPPSGQARPTVRRGGGGEGARPARPPSGGVRPVPQARPPARGGGGSSPAARPTSRGGSPPAARPPARGGGGSPPASRPQVRRGGGGGSPPAARRPPRRGGGGGGGSQPAARPPARGGGGSPSAARRPARGGGGSSPATRAPARRSGGGVPVALPLD